MRFPLTTKQLRWLVAGLMVAAAALFAFGVSMESSNEASHAAEEPGGETLDESKEDSEEAGEEEEEGIFGIDAESPVAVGGAILLSIALAIAVATGWRPNLVVPIVAAVAVLFAVLDFGELLAKLEEDESAIATVAGAVALLHLAAAAGAATLMMRQPEKA